MGRVGRKAWYVNPLSWLASGSDPVIPVEIIEQAEPDISYRRVKVTYCCSTDSYMEGYIFYIQRYAASFDEPSDQAVYENAYGQDSELMPEPNEA